MSCLKTFKFLTRSSQVLLVYRITVHLLIEFGVLKGVGCGILAFRLCTPRKVCWIRLLWGSLGGKATQDSRFSLLCFYFTSSFRTAPVEGPGGLPPPPWIKSAPAKGPVHHKRLVDLILCARLHECLSWSLQFTTSKFITLTAVSYTHLTLPTKRIV